MKAGDLVTVKNNNLKLLGLLVEYNKDCESLPGHCVVYWINHPKWTGQKRTLHPSVLKKIELSS